MRSTSDQIIRFVTRTALLFLAFITSESTVSAIERGHLTLSDTWITSQIGHIQVSALHLDSLGNLWIGTQSGLYLLTGNHIVNHDLLGSPLRDVLDLGVTKISEDHSGNIYLGTYGLGLVRIDLESGSARHFTEIGGYDVSLPERIYAFSDGLLWIVTPHGLLIVSSLARESVAVELSKKIERAVGKVNSVDHVGSDQFLVGGEQGIVIARLGSGKLEEIYRTTTPRGNIKALTASYYVGEESIIFGTDEGHIGLYNHRNGKIESLSRIKSPTSPRILSIKQFGDGVAISTDHGLFISDSKLTRVAEVQSPNFQRKNYSVSSFVTDRETIWVGTLSGIKLLKSPVFNRFEASHSLKNDDILDIEEDPVGRIWLGTFDGLYFFDAESQSHVRVDNPDTWPKGYSSRISVLESSENDLWVGFIKGRGIVHVNTNTLDAREVPFFQNEILSVLDIKILDETAWIGTHEKGLIRYTSERTVRLLDEGILPATSVNEILQMSDGRLALATIQNVLLLDTETLEHLEVRLDLTANELAPDILEIFEDNRGNLWIGTAGKGLFFASESNIKSSTPIAKKYYFNSLLDNANINNICSTPHGEFWITAENRVARFIPYENEVYLYNSSDGLPHANMATDAALCSRTGSLYFGSPQGYSRLLRIPPVPNYKSKLSVVEIGAAGEKLTPVFPFPKFEKLVIDLLDFPLSIKFVVSDYQEPNNVQYRYRFGEAGKSWNYNGNSNYLNIPALTAGEHRLFIQATNSNGVWNDEITSLNITVNPPPWKTMQAYLIYAAATLGLLWSMHRIYYSYIAERRSKELTIEIEETRNRAEDEIQEQLEYHDELAQAAHEHHGSVLKLLRHCLGETLPEYEGELIGGSAEESPIYMQALSLLEDCTIYDEGDVSIDLRVYVEKLFPAIMPYCQVDPDTIITVNEMKDDPLTLEVGATLAIIIYELAVNALSHAYADDSPANYLRVISRTEYSKETEIETFSIIVRDSGEGIPEDAIDTAPPGSGIALVKSLADNIEADFSYSYRKGTMARISLEVSENRPVFA